MSTATLIRWTGLACVCAGALYALGALLRPVGEDLASVKNSNWMPAHVDYWTSAILMQFGLVGWRRVFGSDGPLLAAVPGMPT
jgi:hypothetical protein